MKTAAKNRPFKDWFRLGLLLLLLIPLELLSARMAYETLSELAAAYYCFATILGNLVVLALAIRSRFAAEALALLLALAIVPYQAALTHRLWRVQGEAARIVAYVYESRVKTGHYPADLAGYAYKDTGVRRYIQGYETTADGGFVVFYRVGTESTSHWYSPGDGWSYYPD